jgi:hypothetical protein
MQKRELPDGWELSSPTFATDAKGVAGRDASAKGAERGRAGHSVAHRRIGGPGALNQDAA